MIENIINPSLYIDGSLLYAKRYATQYIPESCKNSKKVIIEIYCLDFNSHEPICTKYNNKWIKHPFLKDFDFWDFTGDNGY